MEDMFERSLSTGQIKLILKAAPPPEMPALRHEHGLLRWRTSSRW